VNLYPLIRSRYPNTALMVLYVIAACSMLPFRPVRKAGEVMLGLLAVAWFTFLAGCPWRRK
jgi:hypothetical protein